MIEPHDTDTHDILWEHRNQGHFGGIIASMTLDFAFIGLGLYLLWNVGELTWENALLYFDGLLYLALGFLHMYLKTSAHIRRDTVHYQLTNQGIRITYGLFKRVSEHMPYEDIIEAKLEPPGQVGLPSVILYTMSEHRFRGYDRRQNQTRPLPSIDYISEAPEVYAIIKRKIANNPRADQIQTLYQDMYAKAEGFMESSDTLRWNRILGYTYLLLGLTIILAIIDIHMLPDRFKEDHIKEISQYATSGGSSSVAYYSITTASDLSFLVTGIGGHPGCHLTLHKSPIFGIVHKVDRLCNTRKTTGKTLLNSILTWFFPLFGIYYLTAGLTITVHRGRIRSDEKGFLYIGPIASVYILRICLSVAGVF